MQGVSYPANAVNVGEGQEAGISGRIASAIQQHAKTDAQGKPRRPATLIVNGAAMPLAVNEAGQYARPYSFGKGSNSVEVRDSSGKSVKRVQFYDSNTSKAQSKLRVVLSWDSDGTDLDLHVVTPSGQHAYYGNRVIQGGGALDVDVTTGYGPEIFAHPAPEKATYLVFVNYFGGVGDDSAMTTATVSIITNENTADEKLQSFVVPMRKAGELTMVQKFVF